MQVLTPAESKGLFIEIHVSWEYGICNKGIISYAANDGTFGDSVCHYKWWRCIPSVKVR